MEEYRKVSSGEVCAAISGHGILGITLSFSAPLVDQ